MCRIHGTVKCYLFLILTRFYEHINLDPNQSLRYIFYNLVPDAKILSRSISEVKKSDQ